MGVGEESRITDDTTVKQQSEQGSESWMSVGTSQVAIRAPTPHLPSVTPFYARDNSLVLFWCHSASRYNSWQMDRLAATGAVLHVLSEYASRLSFHAIITGIR